MDKAVITRAANKLELRDIVLHTNVLERNEDEEPSLYPPSVRQRSGLKITTDLLRFVDTEDKEIPIVRTYVHLWVSGFRPSESDTADTRPLFSIRAVFRVDYLENKRLTDTEIEQFSRFNVVHNVWPFWRQHVFQIVNNAKLPQVSIPFFRQVPGAPKAKRTRRRIPKAKKQ